METDLKEKKAAKEAAGGASTEVATTDQRTSLAELSALDYGADAGAGYENQTGEDVGIPFMVMLQPGSPEVQAEDATAKAGMFINRTTGELTSGKDGLVFIPVYTMHEMVEWKPRDSGGGLVARHAMDSDLATRARKDQPLGQYKHPDLWRHGLSVDDLKKINDLVETFTVYGLTIDDNGLPAPAIINFASTHIKPYKDWVYKMRMVVVPLPNGGRLTSRQLPMWALCWKIVSDRQEKNGHTWYVPRAAMAGENVADSLVKPGSELYNTAKGLYEAVRSGTVKADEGSLTRGAETADPAPARASTDQEDAPY